MSHYDSILAYHAATKHHFKHYARSAGYMDWRNQPNPFRGYDGAEQIPLPFSAQDPDLAYGALYSVAQGQAESLTLASVGAFCELALGLSAWKQAGASRWSLRINPSSGNLHPTEGYLLLPDMQGVPGGMYHYTPLAHSLECRIRLPKKIGLPFQELYGPGFGVALTTIFWRESWKYGERAFRYCNLDAGHALAALVFAARLFNWHCFSVAGAGDDQLGALLGMDRTMWRPLEREAPEMLCWVCTRPVQGALPQHLPDELVDPVARMPLSGQPNQLSPQAVDWAIIEKAAKATVKPATRPVPLTLSNQPVGCNQPMDDTAVSVIRQRRSAVNYNPQKSISTQTFLSILDPTLARAGTPPFGADLMSPAAQLLLFVHRVEGMAPGLYLLARGLDDVTALRNLWRADFQWQQATTDMPLYRLLELDVTFEAMELSCHQQIAGRSAFAAAMLVPFETHLQPAPYLYRHLHWECGMIGQVLYLGAEAHGLRATGIGCFFDDEVHRMLGIKDNSYQSLYHFTVGYPIEDERLMTLPAYHHLKR